MIRVISNTTSPTIESMNVMIGGTFKEYEERANAYKINGWAFLRRDVEKVVWQSEDALFREVLMS